MAERRSYYAVIPANIRYDTRLMPNAKLLYGEITALCNEKGYCWASNDYFAELYNVKKETVSRWISELIEFGYLTREIVYKEGTSQILNRYLRINQYPIDEKRNRYPRKNQYPIDEKINTPIDEKVKDNNTSINNTFNNKREYKQDLSPSENTPKAKPIRHKYGSYKNVLLSDEDMVKVKNEFSSDYEDRIERLSEYMASTGKRYKNHLATIRNWAKRDRTQAAAPKNGWQAPVKRETMPNWQEQQPKSDPSRKAEIEKMMEEYFTEDMEEDK